jgi:hypothetical protein
MAEGQTPDSDNAPATDEAQAQETTNDEATPVFDGPFDEARAARLVTNLRTELAQLKSERDTYKSKVTEREDAEKTELQKLQDRLAAAERERDEIRSERLVAKIAAEYKIDDELLDFIRAGSEDEIKAKAEKLAAKLGLSEPKDDGKEDLPRRPRTKLQPGSGSSDDLAGFDPNAVARAARQR